jgi:very-short-patch-repair endonuclease
MSYSNQRDHELLDRKKIRDVLLEMTSSRVKASPGIRVFSAHLESLKSQCESQLEKSWLDYLVARDLRLPSCAQKFFEKCATRPDFVYEKQHTVIYVDGPPHDFSDRQQRDREKTVAMEDLGLTVLRFHHEAQWDEILAAHPHIFGVIRPATPSPEPTAALSRDSLDLELFPGDWQPIVQELSGRDGLMIEPGGDVATGGRVLGAYVLDIAKNDRRLWVVDGREHPGNSLTGAIAALGQAVLAVDPTESSAVDKILSKLGGLG